MSDFIPKRGSEFKPRLVSSDPSHMRQEIAASVLPKGSSLALPSSFHTRNAGGFFGGNMPMGVSSNPGGGGGGSSMYHMQRPYMPGVESPDRVQYPKTREEANRAWRLFHETDPIFGTAIDMYAEMLVSDFDIMVGDEKSHDIRDTLEYMCQTTNFMDRLRYIIREYLVMGEAIPHNFFDDSLGIWTYIALHNPDFIEVMDSPIVNMDPILSFIPDEGLRSMMSAGTPEAREFRSRLPADFVSKILARQKIRLSPLNCTFIPRKLHPYQTRGTSLASRMWRIFMFEDAVYNSTIATARRAACFVPGTKILTNLGIKNIEEVRVGDSVISGDGRLKKVLASWGEDTDEIVEIRAAGSEVLECTPNHRFKMWARPRKCACGCGTDLVRNSGGTPRFFVSGHYNFRRDPVTGQMTKDSMSWKTFSRSPSIRVLSGYEPIQVLNAENIMKGDFLMIPRKFDEAYMVVTQKDRLMARLLGYYLAEGCQKYLTSKHRKTGELGVVWSFSLKEFDTWGEDIVQIGKELGVHIQKIKKKPSGIRVGGTVVSMTHRADVWLSNWIFDNAGKYSSGKVLSELVMSWPLELKEELLKGLYRGDGHPSKDGESIHYATVSKSLAYQVRLILAQLGVFGSIRRSVKSNPTWNDCYSVISCGDGGRRLRELVWGVSLAGPLKEHAHSWTWMDENYIYVPVMKASLKKKQSKVFNLTVEGDHSYIANGLSTLNSPIKVVKLGDAATGWIPAPGSETKLLEMLQRAETDPQCFVPETPITLADGTQKAIGDLSIGEKLLDKNGNVCEVEVIQEEFTDELVEIDIVGSPIILCTPNHQWPIWGGPRTCSCGCGAPIKNGNYVANHGGGPSDKKYQDHIPGSPIKSQDAKIRFLEGFNPYQKVKASELRRGDYLMIPRKFAESASLDVSCEKARLLGYYVAEGNGRVIYEREDSSVRMGVELSFNVDEEFTLVEDVCDIVEKLCGYRPYFSKGVRHNIQVLICRNDSSDLADWLVLHGGSGARTKKLSESVMAWPLSLKYEFLKGYISGDGGVYAGGISHSDEFRYSEVSSTSIQLMNQVKMIFAQLGTHASFHSGTQGERSFGAGNSIYRLSVYGEMASRLARDLTGFNQQDSERVSPKQWWFDSDFIYVKIRGVSKTKYDELRPVVNMTVSGDHSYLTNGIGTYNSWLVYNYGITFEQWGDPGRAISIGKEHDIIERVKLLALGLSKSFMTGEVTYASQSLHDAIIRTNTDSYKTLGDVSIGDTIKDRFGYEQKVLDVLDYPSPDKMVKITVYGNRSLTLTDNHFLPVFMRPRTCLCGCGEILGEERYVAQGHMYWRSFVPGHHKYKYRGDGVERTWIEYKHDEKIIARFPSNHKPHQKLMAAEVIKGDWLMIPRKFEVADVPATQENLKKARLLGYYTAEGCCRSNVKSGEMRSSKFSFGDKAKEASYALDTILLAEFLGGKATWGLASGLYHTVYLPVASVEITHWLDENAHRYSYSKYLSSEVMHWNLELKKEFIKGLFRGDGYIFKGGNGKTTKNRLDVVYVTTSQQLALQVELILAQLGYPCSVHPNEERIDKKGYVHKPDWHISIFGKQAYSLAKLVWGEVESVWSQLDFEGFDKGRQGDRFQCFKDDDFLYLPVEKVEIVEVDKKRDPIVRSLVVENTASYTTNNIASYNSAKSGLQVFLRRLLSLRQLLENIWIYPKFFRPISEINDWVTPTKSEINHKYRVKRTAQEIQEKNMVMVPSLKWKNKLDPTVDTDVLAAYQLLEKFGIKLSKATVSGAVGVDWEDELHKSLTEFKTEKETKEKTLGPTELALYEQEYGKGAQQQPGAAPPGGPGAGAKPPAAAGKPPGAMAAPGGAPGMNDASHPPGSAEPTTPGALGDSIEAPSGGGLPG